MSRRATSIRLIFSACNSGWDYNLGVLLLNHLRAGLERTTSTSSATWRQKKESSLMTWLEQQVNPTYPHLSFSQSQWNCMDKIPVRSLIVRQ